MPTPDLERSACFLLWGCNPSATNIKMAQAIQAARSRGMKLITVDPRGLVVGPLGYPSSVQPGTDGALALSIAHVLVERGWFDEAFVRMDRTRLSRTCDTGRLLRWSELIRDGDDGYVAWTVVPCVAQNPASMRQPSRRSQPELDVDAMADSRRSHSDRDGVPPAERATERLSAGAGRRDHARARREHPGRGRAASVQRPVAHSSGTASPSTRTPPQNGRAISVSSPCSATSTPRVATSSPRAPAIRDVELNDL